VAATAGLVAAAASLPYTALLPHKHTVAAQAAITMLFRVWGWEGWDSGAAGNLVERKLQDLDLVRAAT
jgi:hypothetical protein